MPRVITTTASAKRKKTAPAAKTPNPKVPRVSDEEQEAGDSPSIESDELDIAGSMSGDKENSLENQFSPLMGVDSDDGPASGSTIRKQKNFLHEEAENRPWSSADKEIFLRFFGKGMTRVTSDPVLIEQCAQETGKTIAQVKVGNECYWPTLFTYKSFFI